LRAVLVLGSSLPRVGEGLRGWSVSSAGPLVRPSSLASPCPSRRDAWLLARGWRLPRSGAVARGISYHEEVLGVFRAAVRGPGALAEAVSSVRTHAGVWAVGVAAAWLGSGGVPPIAVEPRLPPAAGFTSSRPDLVIGSSPAEVAYTNGSREYLERKRVELAAYALIIEALTKSPVSRGYLIRVGDDTVTVEEVPVDEGLRVEALRAREEIAAIMSSDEPPPMPGNCPRNCPLREVCEGVR